jgi:hypothetical protein
MPSRLIATPSAPVVARPEAASSTPHATRPEDDARTRPAANASALSRRLDDDPARLATPSASGARQQAAPQSRQSSSRSRSEVSAASPEGSSLSGEGVAHRAPPVSPARLLGDRRAKESPSPPDAVSPARRLTTPTPTGPVPTVPDTVSRRVVQAATIEDRPPHPTDTKARDRGPPSLFQSTRTERAERQDGDPASAPRPSPPRRGDPATATHDRTDEPRPSPSPHAESVRPSSTSVAPPAPSRAPAAQTDGPEAAPHPRETPRPKPPEVRIDIGRIEVTLPAPPRAIIRQRAQPPPLSLKPRRAPEP